MKNKNSHHSKINDRKSSLTAKYNLVFVLFIIAIFLSLLFYLLPFRLKSSFKEEKKVYFADNITPAHQKIINLFNEHYKGQVEIVPVDLPFAKFNTNERKELIARTLRNRNSRIDVFTVDQIWLPRFAKWAEPLSRYFSRKEISKIFSSAITTCYNENILVGMPLHMDIGVMYFRRDIIKKFPNFTELENELANSITWRKFIELKEKYYSFKPFYVFQGDNYEGLVVNFLEIFAGSNIQLIKNNCLQLDQPEIKKSCQFMVDLIHKYSVSPEIVTTFNESASYKYALINDVPFFRGWPGCLKEVVSYPDGLKKVQFLEIAALPHFQGQNPVSAFGGWNLMISKNSTKQNEAALFLKFILSEEAQKILYETAGYLPVIKSIYEDKSYIKKYRNLSYFRKLLDEGIHRPSHPNYTEMSNILSSFIHKALKNELPVEEALVQAAEIINSKRILSN